MWPEQDFEEALKQEIIQRTALKRQGRAQDIASAVLFFIRDAHYITGQVLPVDGGRMLHK